MSQGAYKQPSFVPGCIIVHLFLQSPHAESQNRLKYKQVFTQWNVMESNPESYKKKHFH